MSEKGSSSANCKDLAQSSVVNLPFNVLVYVSSPRGDLSCKQFLSAITF